MGSRYYPPHARQQAQGKSIRPRSFARYEGRPLTCQKAVRAFQRLVKHDLESAHNFTLLEEFYPLILETNQLNFGCQAYRTAFDWHIESFSQPDDDEEGNTMGLEHIVPLADMLMQTEKLEDAVDVVRRGQRWLQGRTDERHWDALEDDREYAPNAGPGVEGGEEESEGNELETPLRLRLALLRLRLGHDDEAFVSSLLVLLLPMMLEPLTSVCRRT